MLVDKNANYGILLSGGIDSAILLALLIKENPEIKIQPFTISKTDGAALYADPVINHINKKFNTSVPATIFVGDPTAHHRAQSTTAVLDIFRNYSVDYLFNGINQNPPELDKLPGAPLRDKRSTSPRILLPFVNMYKTDILKIMYDNNFTDLIDITHSCTEQRIGRCCVCWQCTERAWSFNKINKLDTGTL